MGYTYKNSRKKVTFRNNAFQYQRVEKNSSSFPSTQKLVKWGPKSENEHEVMLIQSTFLLYNDVCLMMKEVLLASFEIKPHGCSLPHNLTSGQRTEES